MPAIGVCPILSAPVRKIVSLMVSSQPHPYPETEQANYGEVFTRGWVVEMILDLCEYTSDRDLPSMVLVDPACGDGAFVLPVLDRLIESCQRSGRPVGDLLDSVRAFDLQLPHVESLRIKVEERISGAGGDSDEAERIAAAWVTHADFLRTSHEPESVDFVVGNPPYIRPEALPPALLAEYRSNCQTMGGRADIYIGFFEYGLRMLRPDGVLGFICADRWMRNEYGEGLRSLVASEFSIDVVIEMHDVDAFAEKVASYPAVTVIRKGEQGQPIVVSTTAEFDDRAAVSVVEWVADNKEVGEAENLPGGIEVARLPRWYEGPASWPTGTPKRLQLLEHLEQRFSPIETPRTRISIGVATGADAIFVVKQADLVESERMIPLLMASDITSGKVDWQGRFLVNPWAGPGKLVNLDAYPKLKAYFGTHQDALGGRYVARKGGSDWYRTIDPVHHDLIAKPKLLFPDMKMVSHPVLDEGGYYPHHNLYYITSTEWDLEVLGGLLLSRVAQFFIESYAVRMRGRTLRFQAQYLRRIRVPAQNDLPAGLADQLTEAFRTRDVELATAAALSAYGIDRLPD